MSFSSFVIEIGLISIKLNSLTATATVLIAISKSLDGGWSILLKLDIIEILNLRILD